MVINRWNSDSQKYIKLKSKFRKIEIKDEINKLNKERNRMEEIDKKKINPKNENRLIKKENERKTKNN